MYWRKKMFIFRWCASYRELRLVPLLLTFIVHTITNPSNGQTNISFNDNRFNKSKWDLLAGSRFEWALLHNHWITMYAEKIKMDNFWMWNKNERCRNNSLQIMNTAVCLSFVYTKGLPFFVYRIYRSSSFLLLWLLFASISIHFVCVYIFNIKIAMPKRESTKTPRLIIIIIILIRVNHLYDARQFRIDFIL